MIIFIIVGALLLVGYMYLVKKSIDHKFSDYDPDCVTCNGTPVCMVYWINGYYDIHFREHLCTKHLVQGRNIVRLEHQLLDKEYGI